MIKSDFKWVILCCLLEFGLVSTQIHYAYYSKEYGMIYVVFITILFVMELSLIFAVLYLLQRTEKNDIKG